MNRGFIGNQFRIYFSLLFLAASFLVLKPQPVQAAAGLYLTSSSNSVEVGQTVSISIYVNTNGASANTYSGSISYPAANFEGVRGSYTGSICKIPIEQPDPVDGSANFTCGSPGGYTGTGLVGFIVLKATNPGSGNIGLSNCKVLANDGSGTNIGGGCTGVSYSVVGTGQSPATSTTGGVKTPLPTLKPATTQPSSVGTSPATQAEKPAETPKETIPEQFVPPVPTTQKLSEENRKIQSESAPQEEVGTPEKRTVSAAFQNLFDSFQEVKTVKKDTPGLIVILVSLAPFLLIGIAALYFLFRLYSLEKKRKRTMDQILEMGLSEIAALEGKLDLLSMKGGEGKELYKEEFKKAKENLQNKLQPAKKSSKKLAPTPSA